MGVGRGYCGAGPCGEGRPLHHHETVASPIRYGYWTKGQPWGAASTASRARADLAVKRGCARPESRCPCRRRFLSPAFGFLSASRDGSL